MKKKLSIVLVIFLILVSLCCKVSAFTIVLDPGHGGSDPGASSDDGSTNEKDITLKIAKYLRDYLKQYVDVNVLLTHEGNINGEYSIFDRAIFARNNNADLLVSLHINSYDNNSSPVNGAEIYVTENRSLPKYHDQTSVLANRILGKLEELNIGNRGVRTRLIERDTTDVYSDGTRADYYGIIRYAMRGCHIDDGRIWGGNPANVQNGEGVPAILIEHCFIKGSDFSNFLNTDEKIKNIAIADGKGIVENYGLKLESKKDYSVSFNGINENNDMLTNIEFNTKVGDLKGRIIKSNDLYIEILDKDGKILNDDENVTTSTKVLLKDVDSNEIIKSYNIVIYGDTDGDGKLSSKDALTIIKNKVGKVVFANDYYLEAGRVSDDTRRKKDVPTSKDALYIIKCKTNGIQISQSIN